MHWWTQQPINFQPWRAPISETSSLGKVPRKKPTKQVTWSPERFGRYKCFWRQVKLISTKTLCLQYIKQNLCKPYMGVSKNRDTPTWMVKIMEHPIKNGWFGGKTRYFRKHPYISTVYSSQNPWRLTWFTNRYRTCAGNLTTAKT